MKIKSLLITFVACCVFVAPTMAQSFSADPCAVPDLCDDKSDTKKKEGGGLGYGGTGKDAVNTAETLAYEDGFTKASAVLDVSGCDPGCEELLYTEEGVIEEYNTSDPSQDAKEAEKRCLADGVLPASHCARMVFIAHCTADVKVTGTRVCVSEAAANLCGN